MENVTKDLQLTPEQRTTLLHAVSVFLSKKHIYLYATVQEKLDLLTTHFMNTRELLETQHKNTPLNDIPFNKDYFKIFLNKVKNDINLEGHTNVIKNMHKAIKENKTEIYDTIEFATYEFVRTSPLAALLIDSSAKVLLYFDKEIHKEATYNNIKNKFDLGIKGSDFNNFYKSPSKYIHECRVVKEATDTKEMELKVKLAIVQMHMATAFLHKSPNIFDGFVLSIDVLNKDSDEDISRIHEFNLGRKAIYIHRTNEIKNMIAEFCTAERNGFDTVLESVIESISYCKANKINSFLSITNVIMNNLLVAAFKNKKIRAAKEKQLNAVINTVDKMHPEVVVLINNIGNYIEGYYENKHTRLCAYSVDTAIKNALSTMRRYEHDIFKLANK